ncbi:MAG TPA: urease accessory UreF family protein [Stellaceae bacterium]|jgi:urease accessory protein
MTIVAEPRAGSNLYRLFAWLSPSFPTGAFSYSHGLEAAATAGAVHDRRSLQAWVTAIVCHGSGRMDADILCAAYRAAAAADAARLGTANGRGMAFRASAELALESEQQGEAFLATCDAAWPQSLPANDALRLPPNPPPHGPKGTCRANGGRVEAPRAHICHSVAFGAAAAGAGIALDDALVGYLGAFAANLVSAGLRLGIIGQTDGQRILATIEPAVAAAVAAAMNRDPADFGAATIAADLFSIAHETQYSRLFRS